MEKYFKDQPFQFSTKYQSIKTRILKNFEKSTFLEKYVIKNMTYL